MKKLNFLLALLLLTTLFSCKRQYVESFDGNILLDVEAANIYNVGDFKDEDTVVLEIRTVYESFCMHGNEGPFQLYQVLKDSTYQPVYRKKTYVSHGEEESCEGTENLIYHRAVIKRY
jgi:hypothetical protein